MTSETLEKPLIDPLLHRILSTRRCHKSKGDTDFRLWLNAYIKSLGYSPVIGVEGVITVVTDETSRTLFSCHVDTCHSMAESDGTPQPLSFDPTMGHLMLLNKQTSGCLGADDGAGIYIMLKMLEAKVPGGYIFNTGEEKGGIGSRAFLAKSKEWLEKYHRAVAFDRADTYEVICTQGGSPCASVPAGEALSADLTQYMETEYTVSHRGSFTDTKVFAQVIPECFNIGVGYMYQHSPQEYQDVDHLEALVAAAIKVKWESIPTVRKCPVMPPQTEPKYPTSKSFFKGQDSLWEAGPVKVPKASQKAQTPSLSLMEEIEGYSYDDFLALAEEEPTITADLLCLLFAKKKALQAEVDVLTRFLS